MGEEIQNMLWLGHANVACSQMPPRAWAKLGITLQAASHLQPPQGQVSLFRAAL